MTRSALAVLACTFASVLAAQAGAAQENASLLEPRLEPQASGTEALLQAISVVDDSVVWVSGHEGVVARTQNRGETWTLVDAPAGDSLQFRDVHGVSGRVAVILSAGTGTASRIYRTKDGGGSWNLAFLMDDERGFLDCMDFWDQRGFAYGDSFDGIPYVLRTDDGGASWTRVTRAGLPQAAPGEGGFAASGTCARAGASGMGWIATGAGGAARILRTEDWGETWAATETPVVRGDAAGLTTVSFAVGQSEGLAFGGDLAQMEGRTDNAVRSADGGRTWEASARPKISGPVYGSDYAGRSQVVVVVGPQGADLSPDGGATWTTIDSAAYWAVDFGPRTQGWMVGPGGRITRVSIP